MRYLSLNNKTNAVVCVISELSSTGVEADKIAIVVGGIGYGLKYINLNAKSIPVTSVATSATIQETRPGVGSGLIKRTAKIIIPANDDAYIATLKNNIYYGGANYDSFVLSLYFIPGDKLLQNCYQESTVLFGKYSIDSNISIDESSGDTVIQLIDITTQANSRLNYYSQESLDALQNNDFGALANSPMYYGTFGKVPLIQQASLDTELVPRTAGTVSPSVTSIFSGTVGRCYAKFSLTSDLADGTDVFDTSDLLLSTNVGDGIPFPTSALTWANAHVGENCTILVSTGETILGTITIATTTLPVVTVVSRGTRTLTAVTIDESQSLFTQTVWIDLGTSVFFESSVGNTIRLALDTGEIVKGKLYKYITPTSTRKGYALINLLRNQHWDTVQVYPFVGSEMSGFAFTPADIQMNACQVQQPERMVKYDMWMQSDDIHFPTYGGGVSTAATSTWQLDGQYTGTFAKAMRTKDIKPTPGSAASTRTCAGIAYTTSPTNAAHTAPFTDQLNWATATWTNPTVRLYFTDPRNAANFTLTQAGQQWTAFTIAGDTSLQTPFATGLGYIRLYKSTITKVYVSIDGLDRELPPAYYTITYDSAFAGLSYCAKVEITGNISDVFPTLNIPAQPIIKVDLLYITKMGGACIDLSKLSDDKVVLNNLKYTMDASVDNGIGPFVSAVITTDDTLSSLLDAMLYEAGCTLRWRFFNDFKTFGLGLVSTNQGLKNDIYLATDTSPTRLQPSSVLKIDSSELIVNSSSITVGKLDTIIESGREVIKVYAIPSISYYKDASSSAVMVPTRPKGKKDRVIKVDFKFVTDVESAKVALTSLLTAGHPSGILETSRIINAKLQYNRIDIEAGDICTSLFLTNPSALANTLYDADTGLYSYPYTDDAKYGLVPNLHTVDSVEYGFTPSDTYVRVQLRQTQNGWYNTTTDGSTVTDLPNVSKLSAPNDYTIGDPAIYLSKKNATTCLVDVISSGSGVPNLVDPASINSNTCAIATCDSSQNYGKDPIQTIPVIAKYCVEEPRFCLAFWDFYFKPKSVYIGLDYISFPNLFMDFTGCPGGIFDIKYSSSLGPNCFSGTESKKNLTQKNDLGAVSLSDACEIRGCITLYARGRVTWISNLNTGYTLTSEVSAHAQICMLDLQPVRSTVSLTKDPTKL